MELFTRGVQANFGMGFGVLAFSVAMGALFAVVFAVAHGRVGNLSARTLSVLVAGAMLLSTYVVPSLKYPANPPAVSLDETIRQRTLLYLLMVVVSAAAVRRRGVPGASTGVPAGSLERHPGRRRQLRGRDGRRHARPPDGRRDPGPLRDEAGIIIYPGFPADDLYDFRLYSLGVQVVMWTTIGLVFAALISKVLDGRREGRKSERLAA